MSTNTPQPSSGRLLSWLWGGYLKRYWWLVLSAFLLMAIEGSMVGALAYLIQPMFDNVFAAADVDAAQNAVTLIAFAIAGVFVIRALASFGQRVIMSWVGLKVSTAIQSRLTAHMLTLDGGFFQRHSPGTLIERTRGDSAAAASVWGMLLAAVGRDLVSLISLLTVALLADWKWTLIVVAATPLLAFPLAALQGVVRRTTRIARELAARLTTRLDEIFHGATTIKLSGTETREAQRFSDENDAFVSAQVRSEAGQAAIPSVMDIVAGFGFFAVLLYGGNQIIAGEKSVGEFMSFFTAMGLVFEPMRRLGNVSGAWQAARASLERVYELFETRPLIKSPARPKPLPKSVRSSDIVLENVKFNYGDLPVLTGVNLRAEAGKTTAIVGASGAGKSTIFNLITRLADPKSGRILLGDTATKSLELSELRNLYSVVSQDALLFDESLRDNILMGADVSEDTLAEALKTAHVDDFLPKLDQGLDTPVGPRGSGLSGGQRQRVAIARAVLRDRPILLLDEATSALDARSEKIVQDAIEALSKGRTTLVIAHRLSTIRNADKIVVMDRGEVVDEGTHDELLARGGIYENLHRLQSAESALNLDGKPSRASKGQRQRENGSEATGSTLLGRTSRAFGSVLNLFVRPRG